MVSTEKDRKRKVAASTLQPESKKTKQLPPEPKTDARLTVCMFASFRDKKNIPVRVLLDTGCDTPMLSKQWADSHGVLLVTRTEPKIVENINGERVEGADWQYTFPVTLQYKSHYTKEIFEIGPIQDLSDIMFPYLWIVKHGTFSGVTEENNVLQFISRNCG